MCHVWIIILVTCTMVPFVLTVLPEGTSRRPGKEEVGTSEVPESIMGVFKTTGGSISAKECEGNCKTHFGYILSSPKSRFPITLPNVSADKKTCSCLLNIEKISNYVVKKNLNYDEFLDWGQTATFCSGRVWLSTNKAKVEIQYEKHVKFLDKASQRKLQKAPLKTTQDTAGTSRDSKIYIGFFTTTGSAFTTEACKANCRTTFGYIVPYPGVRMPFAEPNVSADGKTCRCLLNIEPIRDYCIETDRDHEELFKFCKKSYCHCKVWLEDAGVIVEIQYEVEARGSQKKGGTIKSPNPEDKILMATLTDVGFITPGNCRVQCEMEFGFIVSHPAKHIRITIASLAYEKRKLVCQCFLNIEPIKEYFIEKGLDYESFLRQCKISLSGTGYKTWLDQNKVKVEILDTKRSTGPSETSKSSAGTSKGPAHTLS